MASGFLDTDHLTLWQHYQEKNAQKDDPYHLAYFHDHHQPLRTRVLDEVVARLEFQDQIGLNPKLSPACRHAFVSLQGL